MATADWVILSQMAAVVFLLGGHLIVKWIERRRRVDSKLEFPALETLFICELGQDTDIFGATHAEAIANFAREAPQEEKDQLLRDITEFEQRFHNCLDEAFRRWFNGGDVNYYFDMIRAIVNDPDCYKQYDDSGNMRPPVD